MNTSEKLIQKLKKQFPEQCGQIKTLYRCYGLNDGVAFKWSSWGVGSTLVFSYDTMTDCLKHEIGISRAIFNGEYRGWLIGVNKGNG